MLSVEVHVPLEKEEKEVDGFLEVELFVFIEVEHFLGDFEQDSVLGATGPENDFGAFGDDSDLALFIIFVEQVGDFEFEFVEIYDFAVVHLHEIPLFEVFEDLVLVSARQVNILNIFPHTFTNISTYSS